MNTGLGRAQGPRVASRERRIVPLLLAALLGIAVWFRLWHLGSLPGINGDEGWWGVQSLRWLHGEPFETHTTNGNPIDLLLLVPLGLAHRLAPPSFELLRGVPAALNLAWLAIGFFLVRRLYDATTAWIQTAATAILPTAIAHSRFCQDPSQSIPWTGVVVCLSLLGVKERRRAWAYAAGALVAFGLALWTHPTNVFIAPFVVLPFAVATARALPESRRGKWIVTGSTAAAVVLVAAIVAPSVVRIAGSNRLLNRPWLQIAEAHVAHPAAWLEFLENYARLFDGVTVYHYFVDPRLVSIPSDVGFLIVAPAVFAGMVFALKRQRLAVDAALVLAWGGTALLFFAFAGPESIRPHFERWGLCLIVPGTLVFARAGATWIAAFPHHRAWTIGALAALGATALGSFYLNYFRQLETIGGRSHITFVTAPTEPKRRALEDILSRRTGDEPVLIVAGQWWHFWPIAYLARGHANVTVTMTLPPADGPEFRDRVARGRLFIVEFVGSAELASARKWIAAGGFQSRTSYIKDMRGRNLLSILQVTSAAERQRPALVGTQGN